MKTQKTPFILVDAEKCTACDLCAEEGAQPWCVKACRDHGALTSVGSGETVTRKSRERAVQARNAYKFIPPIDGIDKQGVHSCKQLAAADRLDQYQGSAAVVIGSRAIGIEDGEALKKRGYEVTIIELLDWVSPPPTRARMPLRARISATPTPLPSARPRGRRNASSGSLNSSSATRAKTTWGHRQGGAGGRRAGDRPVCGLHRAFHRRHVAQGQHPRHP